MVFNVIYAVRVVKSILILLYVLSSLPVLASYHYCLGRVKQISFYESIAADCVCPAPEETGDCCDDDQQLLDFQDDHAGSSQQVTLHDFAHEIVLPIGLETPLFVSQKAGLPQAHAPPLLVLATPLYVQHQAFLI
jgi:hypothetical protein